MREEKRIKPSSAGFCMGHSVITEYPSGCLRFLLLDYWKHIKSDIPEVNWAVGSTHEAMYARTLTSDIFGAEVPIEGEVNGIPVYGKMDFVTTTKKGNILIHETKGTVSPNTIKKVIEQGNWKINQLAQLVFYMLFKKVNNGKLVIGGYKYLEDSKLFKLIKMREFKVKFGVNGDILIDGEYSGYHISDQLQHQYNSAQVLKNEEMWDRPENATSFMSPCEYCVYSEVCMKWDLGEISSKEEVLTDSSLNEKD